MTEELKGDRWWQTIIGILTIISGLITGLGGLLWAVHDIEGVFPNKSDSVAVGYQVYGEIEKHWKSLGGSKGFLGEPLTDESPTPDGIGRFNHFQGGSIYWTPKTKAHEVHGLIRDKWSSLSWERGALGYPITDEYQSGTFRRNDFCGGLIRWSLETGTQVLYGSPSPQPNCAH